MTTSPAFRLTVAFLLGFGLGALTLDASGAPPGTFRRAAVKALADPALPAWKRALFVGALDRRAPELPCQVSLYHPREAGTDWKRWVLTSTGTRVRPGVACVQASRWSELGGAWIWVPSYGIARVEDRDVYRSKRAVPWLDLAAPGPPHGYDAWLADKGRARLAKAFGRRPGTFVILKKGKE